MTAIVDVQPLGFPWQTLDPFLFCVYHDDAYPKANGRFGPDASLAGRNIGSDFEGKDGWRMYHGETVPGFPAHPHRGFETVTIVRKGLIDHSDSLGAAARFGKGDVQWLTAGRGIVHAETFPLLDVHGPNPLELFQIWLNLPARSKMSSPHFTMFWSQDIPRHVFNDAQGRATTVACIAGRMHDIADAADVADAIAAGAIDARTPPAPPPDSWAAQADSDLAIWTLAMAPGAQWTLPPARGEGTRRRLYFFKGDAVVVDGQRIDRHAAIEVAAGAAIALEAGVEACEFLVLQGRPIGEPVAQHGPFVMNTQAELQQAFDDYRRTQFGGWPWTAPGPVHGEGRRRFARHADGREESFPFPDD